MEGIPSTNGSISVKETLERIDDIIKQQQDSCNKLQTCILAMKLQRNGLLPISRLPPEIMCYIFTLGQLPDRELYFGEPRRDRLDWINFTHVCRHWRDIALNSPTLWVDLPVGNFRWVEEMLERSKGSGLIIEVPPFFTSRDPGLELAFEHLCRIKALCLRGLSQATWTNFQKMLSGSAPQLRSLRLMQQRLHDAPDALQQPLLISGDVLCQTEQLRKLELIKFEVNWNSHSHLLRSLTHLKLDVTSLPATSVMTDKQFMDALNNMPDLEVLDLADAFRVQNYTQGLWASENIHLARLRTLDISSEIAEVEAFFRCVSFPPSAEVRVSCRESRRQPSVNPDFSGVIFGLARSYSNALSKVVFRSLIVEEVTLEAVKVELFVDDLADIHPIQDTTSDATALLQLEFIISYDGGSFAVQEKLLHDIFSGPMRLINDLWYLYLGEMPTGIFDTVAIDNALEALPQLCSLGIVGDLGGYVFKSLEQSLQDLGHPEDLGAIRDQVLYLPDLSSISLYMVDFVEDVTTEDGNYLMTVEFLQDCLIRRYEFGAAIERLTLRSCFGLSDVDVQLLGEIVVDIDWDEF
ncbi:hypothetical protein BJ912DRAFT_878727 [Pholiota molesta]|nr:hypothetical protein BJ912DRAFT_878727 [Pholiota molesta]